MSRSSLSKQTIAALADTDGASDGAPLTPISQSAVTAEICPGVRLMDVSDGRTFDEWQVAQEVMQHAENLLRSAYEVGRRLLWARAVLPHGQFSSWCKEYVPFSQQTCGRYMEVARFFIGHPHLLQPLGMAPLKKVLFLTTLPPEQQALIGAPQMPEMAPEAILSTPLAELRDRLKALEKEAVQARAETGDALKEQRRLAGELERLQAERVEREATVARLKGYVSPEEMAWCKGACGEIRNVFEREMLLAGGKLDVLAQSFSQLPGETQANALGLVEWMRARVELEVLRFQLLTDGAGGLRPVTGADFTTLETAPRTLAEQYPLPEGRKPPLWE